MSIKRAVVTAPASNVEDHEAITEASVIPAGADVYTEPPGGEDAKLLLEQYKLMVESSDKVSERRAAAHTLLLTANTLIVGIYTVAVGKDVGLQSAGRIWQAAIPLAGLAMTLAWFSLIRSYRTLNSAKFVVIHDMEKKLPWRPFQREWEILGTRRTWRYIALSKVEQAVPLVFAALYAGLGLSVLLR